MSGHSGVFINSLLLEASMVANCTLLYLGVLPLVQLPRAKKGAHQEVEYIQWVFANYCSGGCVASFCGILGLYPLGKKFGGLKRVVRVGSQRDLLKIPLANDPHHTFQPIKIFAQGSQT